MSQLVLIVDDEPSMLVITGVALEARGLDWVGAGTAAEALDVLLNRPVDLVVLDIMLPGQSGLELCRAIRARSDIPIILVTALGSTTERIAGLEAGADDYVTKPFSPRELALRVAAVLRRERVHPASGIADPSRRQVGDLILDAAAVQVSLGARRLHVSAGEFRLLWALAEVPGQTMGWRELFAAMGEGTSAFSGREAVRTAIYRLRARLGDSPRQPSRLLTDRGRGYRLVAPDITGL